MKISQFIEKALYHDNFGYYKTKNPLGEKGDFITAPEVSQIFGELLGAYLLNISNNIDAPFSLVEMGAGRGTLFKDILQTIQNLAQKQNKLAINFLNNARFHIIEINPVLQGIQHKNLQNYSIKWHNDFDGFLNFKEGRIIFISNELFDCFAIDQYVKTSQGWRERLINFEDENNFTNPKFSLAEFDKKINDFVNHDIGLDVSMNVPERGVFEYSKTAREFMDSLCQSLVQFGGVAINVDYGYIENEFVNSLQAIKNHQKISIFDAVGNADITALVDFFALDKIVKNHRLKSSLVTQRDFLVSLGAVERAEFLIKKNPAQKFSISSALDRLIDKDKMGDLFKVHIVWQE